MAVGVMEDPRLILMRRFLMFRSFLRVVVVAVVVLGFTLSLAPAAHAGIHGLRASAAVKADHGWWDAAFAWLARWVTGEKPKSPTLTTAIGATGSCIDPLGCPGG
jgi:hypothetical protein